MSQDNPDTTPRRHISIRRRIRPKNDEPSGPSRRGVLTGCGSLLLAGSGATWMFARCMDPLRPIWNDIKDRRTTLGTSVPPSENDLEELMEAYTRAYQNTLKVLTHSERHKLVMTKIKAAIEKRTLKLENEISDDDLSIILYKYGNELSELRRKQSETDHKLPFWRLRKRVHAEPEEKGL